MDLTSFQSDRLKYRGFKEDDFEELYNILGEEEVCKYLPGDNGYSKEQVKKWLDYFLRTFVIEEKNLHFIVSLKNTDEVVGYCGCSYVEEYQCNEIEFFLKPKFFRNGYGSEMALKMKDVALELDLMYLVGLADINNIASQKVLEKTGYQFVKIVEHWGLTLRLYEMNL